MEKFEQAIEILNLINSATPGIVSLLLALKNANPEAPVKDILAQAGDEFHKNMEDAERILQRIMNSSKTGDTAGVNLRDSRDGRVAAK